MKMSLYFLGSLSLLFSGVIFFFLGITFLVNDTIVFLDWEFLSMNSCCMTMTLLFDWMSLVFVGCVFS